MPHVTTERPLDRCFDRRLPPALLALAATTALVVGLAGCNTVEGAGKDVQKAGEAVQDAAN